MNVYVHSNSNALTVTAVAMEIMYIVSIVDIVLYYSPECILYGDHVTGWEQDCHLLLLQCLAYRPACPSHHNDLLVLSPGAVSGGAMGSAGLQVSSGRCGCE